MNAALVNILERFENNNCKNLTILNIGRRKSRFKGYKIAASNDIVNKICESYLKSAKNSLESLNIEEYDFEGNSNKSILELDERLVDVNNLEDVFAEQADLITVIDKDTAFDKFHYIAIRYRYINDEVNEVLTIFAKYRQPAKSFRKSFKVAFMNDEIKEVKSEILSFDGYAEVRQFNNKFYIVQETTMSSLFDYKEGIKKYIDDHVEEINEFSILLNLDRFISDCKEDGRYNGRLCKAIQTQGFKYVHEAKENLKTYFENFEISLTLNEENEIQYTGKEDINEILKVLLRHYVFDGLNGEKLLVKGVEEIIRQEGYDEKESVIFVIIYSTLFSSNN